MLNITIEAMDKILSLIEQENQPDLVLRVAINGRGPGGFQYDLKFIREAEKQPDDLVQDVGPFRVVIDAGSAENLQGATLDYVQNKFEGGFTIDNPNLGFSDPKAQQVHEVIETQINPAIAAHGGHVTLLDVQGDTAYVALGGGCQGCGMANVTLKQGIEVAIKQAVPEIKHVIDQTDHAAGTNPYYQSSKGGASPLV